MLPGVVRERADIGGGGRGRKGLGAGLAGREVWSRGEAHHAPLPRGRGEVCGGGAVEATLLLWAKERMEGGRGSEGEVKGEGWGGGGGGGGGGEKGSIN